MYECVHAFLVYFVRNTSFANFYAYKWSLLAKVCNLLNSILQSALSSSKSMHCLYYTIASFGLFIIKKCACTNHLIEKYVCSFSMLSMCNDTNRLKYSNVMSKCVCIAFDNWRFGYKDGVYHPSMPSSHVECRKPR